MPPRIPRATYRLQLTKDFTFDDAAALAPYLAGLGISHVYASPFLKARAGSTHGYDIVDHNRLNPELGGDEAFERLIEALRRADLGLILDFVPNHMGVGLHDNLWWLDVLEWGPRSPYARFFDIAWDTLPFKKEGGVLLPILGKFYGEALEDGEITLKYDPGEGTFSAWYYEHRLPIRPTGYGEILRNVVTAADAAHTPAGAALLALADRYAGPGNPDRKHAPAFKAALAGTEGAAEVIARGLDAYRPGTGGPGAVLALHRLLERQNYRVAHWRLAASEINYRRFFDVSDLAGLRMEDMRAFTATHHLVMRLIAEGRLQGLRLDHIDGLRDPHQYTRRLQRMIRKVESAAQDRPRGRREDFYLLVEKILAPHERDPKFPGVAGTTGYEWLNVISRLLLDGRGLAPLEQTEQNFTGRRAAFPEILEASKRRVLGTILISEFTVLTRLLARIAAGHWSTRDYTADRLEEALRLYVVHFPVYRTYVTAEGTMSAERALIDETIAKARSQWQGGDGGILDFLRDVLTLDLVAPDRRGYSHARVTEFAMKVQQFTGPLMAKSLEDTAFYRWFVLLALNEVGGEPIAGALPLEEFHAGMQHRVRTAPHGLTATATHDTKRGEDARARILVLSEIPEEWAQHVATWRDMNAPHRKSPQAPSPGHEYMLYQALLGAWPLQEEDGFADRIAAYALKAAREGKRETSWIEPHADYEEALEAFLRTILDRGAAPAFRDSFGAFATRTALVGALNSLSQLTLKSMMPGLPDIYQGTEFWDLSLVDPDNRRPVDYPARSAALAQAGQAVDWAALASGWHDGRIKFALTQKLLALRASLPALFATGAYVPLAVRGADADHVIAFERRRAAERVVVIVGRHFARASQGGRVWRAGGDWDATIDVGSASPLVDVLTPGAPSSAASIAAASLLRLLPVAVLRSPVVS